MRGWDIVDFVLSNLSGPSVRSMSQFAAKSFAPLLGVFDQHFKRQRQIKAKRSGVWGLAPDYFSPAQREGARGWAKV